MAKIGLIDVDSHNYPNLALMKNSAAITEGLKLWTKLGKKDSHGAWGTVYVLVNFDTTMEENLERIYTLRNMGFTPYVMVYDKPHAPKEIRALQRWCNNIRIFRKCPRFEDYAGGTR